MAKSREVNIWKAWNTHLHGNLLKKGGKKVLLLTFTNMHKRDIAFFLFWSTTPTPQLIHATIKLTTTQPNNEFRSLWATSVLKAKRCHRVKCLGGTKQNAQQQLSPQLGSAPHNCAAWEGKKTLPALSVSCLPRSRLHPRSACRLLRRPL